MAELNVVAERIGKFRLAINNRSRSIECQLQGFWSRDDGSHFCSVLEQEMTRLRRYHGSARAILDMSLSRIQIFTAMSLPRSKTMILEGDRVAVVVTSTLLRLAMKQQPVLTRDHAFFDNWSEAQDWLGRS